MRKMPLYIFVIGLYFFAHVLPVRADALETAGDIGSVAVPLTAVAMTLAKNDKEGVLQFSKSFLATMATTYGLRYTIQENRPNGHKRSFPSAHTSSAFAGAAFIQMRYGWTYGIPAYIVSSMVAYSRVDAKEHWTHDVLASAAIGIASNLIFTKPFKDTEIVPLVRQGLLGIVIEKRF